jgi:hypothetical protein
MISSDRRRLLGIGWSILFVRRHPSGRTSSIGGGSGDESHEDGPEEIETSLDRARPYGERENEAAGEIEEGGEDGGRVVPVGGAAVGAAGHGSSTGTIFAEARWRFNAGRGRSGRSC